jgi:radical SAM protein with 4Fe4S-binding SPASM domain
MVAKLAPRISLDRENLQDVIPLDTPFVLHIEPTNRCNLRCRFCPMGDHDLVKENAVHQGMMSTETFKLIIVGLYGFKSNIKTMHFYGNGEPLLNPNLYNMVKIAKESGRVNFIDTTTNGVLFTKERTDNIIQSGIDKIIISVNGLSDEQYLRNTQTKIDFGKFVDNIRYLYDNRGECKIFIKSISELYSTEEKERFFNIFSPMSDYIFLENLITPWPGFDTEKRMGFRSLKSAFNDTMENKTVCCSMFYTIVIKWNGAISLCCTDWKNDLVIGDIKTKRLKAFWDSDILHSYQLQQLKGERYKNPVCRDCNQISQGIYDNIDPYREQILKRMEKR